MKSTIVIHGYENKWKREVPCKYFGPLCVHPTVKRKGIVKGKFTLTHVATNKALMIGFPSELAAIRHCKILMKDFDFERPVGRLQKNKRLHAAVLKLKDVYKIFP